MAILELMMYILAITMIVIIMSKKTIMKQYVLALLYATMIVFFLHIFFGEARWQLYMFYGALIILGIVVYLKNIIHINLNRLARISIITILAISLFIFLVSILVFPMYEIPSPTGDYLIGTDSYIIEDETRDEHYSQNINDHRKIKIQIWYPAETIDGYEQAPWLEDGVVVSRGLSRDIGLPFFVLDHTANIMSSSYENAPLSNASDTYPIIIISHGWRGFKNLHTDFAEELASIGYIVISIDHTYGSVATVFNDDDIAYLNPEALPERETTPDFLTYANRLVMTYAGDVTTTINYLEDLNNGLNNSRFTNRLDLTKIGLLGHSTGGGADVAIALSDDRIDVVIGLDAWVEPIIETEIDKGLTIPSLFIRSETWETGVNNITLNALIENSSHPPLLYQIEGTTHYDFTMVYMYSPFTRLIGFSGDVDSKYLNSILKSMISNFFDETLKDEHNSEFDPDAWDEVNQIK